VDALDTTALEKEDVLRLLSSVLAPRPLLLLSTVSPQGQVNLAPFSSVVPLAAMPPLLGVVIHPSAGGGRKTTLANIEATSEFVAHPVTAEFLDDCVRLSTSGVADRGELEARLRLAPSDLVKPPRALALPIQIECRTRDLYEPAGTETTLVVAEIARLHVGGGLFDGAAPVLERFQWIGHVATLAPGAYAFTRGGEIVRVSVPRE
jgi:flavin reductase (DIM6/NTAB) family NADH-FMN oxidoreductase RutF